jgi:hypothetical protein
MIRCHDLPSIVHHPPPSTIRYPSFTIHHSPSTICQPAFTIRHSPSIISPSIISTITPGQSFAIHRHSSSPSINPPSTIHHPSLTIRYRLPSKNLVLRHHSSPVISPFHHSPSIIHSIQTLHRHASLSYISLIATCPTIHHRNPYSPVSRQTDSPHQLEILRFSLLFSCTMFSKRVPNPRIKQHIHCFFIDFMTRFCEIREF